MGKVHRKQKETSYNDHQNRGKEERDIKKLTEMKQLISEAKRKGECDTSSSYIYRVHGWFFRKIAKKTENIRILSQRTQGRGLLQPEPDYFKFKFKTK